MRLAALELIGCPRCNNPLHLLNVSVEHAEHIMTGTLKCDQCSNTYPIIQGVPRLLLNNSDPNTATGQAYADYFSTVAPSGTNASEPLYGNTLEQELEDFRSKTCINDWNQLKGLVFLDAGCGLARIENKLSQYCKSVVAFDVTPAVEMACAKWKNLPNVHVIQGDLTSIPLLSDRFDMVWCDGALPYVSNFGQALTELLRVCSPNGFLYSWCYGLFVPPTERWGRFFHSTRLPVKTRLRLIRIVCWCYLAGTSILSRKSSMDRVEEATETALDFSLSGQVNHISQKEIQSQLERLGYPCRLAEQKNVVSFQVGQIPS